VYYFNLNYSDIWLHDFYINTTNPVVNQLNKENLH